MQIFARGLAEEPLQGPQTLMSLHSHGMKTNKDHTNSSQLSAFWKPSLENPSPILSEATATCPFLVSLGPRETESLGIEDSLEANMGRTEKSLGK